MNIVELQDMHCDYTRDTEKRFRSLRNIGEVAPHFPINEPVICFGSGDGFEVEVWQLLGYDAIGCEISSIKKDIASKYGIRTINSLYDGARRNVYCAHTIEHVRNRDIAMKRIAAWSISTTCFIFPIEPNGSMNPSHLSPVKSINDIDIPGMQILLKYERWNDEREGIVIFKKDEA